VRIETNAVISAITQRLFRVRGGARFLKTGNMAAPGQADISSLLSGKLAPPITRDHSRGLQLSLTTLSLALSAHVTQGYLAGYRSQPVSENPDDSNACEAP
jgi:hypothetical protein